MALSRERMLDRMLASDRRYDGRFVTGVLTTGIFCLPSCRGRKPKAENVRFFARPEEALAAGLRPCKRCRPDLFYRRRDPDREALVAAVAALRADPASIAGVGDLARASGVGVSKLGELCRRSYHASPAELIADARLARAEADLLAASRRATIDAGFAAGFASLSTFNARFRRRAGMAPSAFRRLADGGPFVLELPPRFPAGAVLRHLGRDAGSLSERVDGRRAVVAARLDGRPARLVIELGARRAQVRIEGSGAVSRRAAAEAHRLTLRLLGLAVDPRPFERRASREPDVARLVRSRRGLGIPQTRDPWDAVVWVIAGQQVHLGLAFALRRRLIEKLGTPTGNGLELRVPPDAAAVAALEPAELVALGWSRAKADYLVGAARAVAAGELDLSGLAGATAPEAEARLLAVRGLGPWSVHYLLMRAYGFRDCLPAADAGLAQALRRFDGLDAKPDVAAIERRMAAFAPFRSLATFHLWASLHDSDPEEASA